MTPCRGPCTTLLGALELPRAAWDALPPNPQFYGAGAAAFMGGPIYPRP